MGPPKAINGIPQTIKESKALSSLRNKLTSADVEIQNYMTALEAENLRLQKQVAKLQVDNVSLNNRIKAFIENNTVHWTVTMKLGDEHNNPPENKNE
jgi:predicted nuclease with TOPRIM domain